MLFLESQGKCVLTEDASQDLKAFERSSLGTKRKVPGKKNPQPVNTGQCIDPEKGFGRFPAPRGLLVGPRFCCFPQGGFSLRSW